MLTDRCIARDCSRPSTSRVEGWFHYFRYSGSDGSGLGLDFCTAPTGQYPEAGTAWLCPSHEQELAEAKQLPCTGDARVLFPEAA